jgi:PKD repeat protein
VTNSAGTRTAEQTLTIAPPCVAPAESLAIRWSGSERVNQPMSFSVSGYEFQECDSVLWDFNGEGTSTLRTPTFTFGTSGNKTIRVMVTNPAGTLTRERVLSIGADPPPTCAALPNFTITWTGPNGCSSGGSQCRTNEMISFRPGSYVYQECDSAKWEFSDNTTSMSRLPSKSFPTPGTYVVKLTITNTRGTKTTESTIVINQGSTGSCTQVPTQAQVGFTITGPGCDSLGNCTAGSPVTFTARAFGYTFQGCDQISWNFDDNSTATGSSVQHSFASGRTYNVAMRVSNPNGNVTVTQPVTVGHAPAKPICPCTATVPAAGFAGVPVKFSGQPGACEAPFPAWSFGDGTAVDRTGSYSPLHTYSEAGTYAWKFEVSSPEVPTCVVRGTIVIERPPRRRAVRSGGGAD